MPASASATELKMVQQKVEEWEGHRRWVGVGQGHLRKKGGCINPGQIISQVVCLCVYVCRIQEASIVSLQKLQASQEVHDPFVPA